MVALFSAAILASALSPYSNAAAAQGVSDANAANMLEEARRASADEDLDSARDKRTECRGRWPQKSQV